MATNLRAAHIDQQLPAGLTNCEYPSPAMEVQYYQRPCFPRRLLVQTFPSGGDLGGIPDVVLVARDALPEDDTGIFPNTPHVEVGAELCCVIRIGT